MNQKKKEIEQLTCNPKNNKNGQKEREKKKLTGVKPNITIVHEPPKENEDSETHRMM